MSAFELLQRVRALGGEVKIDGNELEVVAPAPLPDNLLQALRDEKAAVMIALGASFDHAVASILSELRPNLPPSLKAISDTKLLVMVNCSIMAAWGKTINELSRNGSSRESKQIS